MIEQDSLILQSIFKLNAKIDIIQNDLELSKYQSWN